MTLELPETLDLVNDFDVLIGQIVRDDSWDKSATPLELKTRILSDEAAKAEKYLLWDFGRTLSSGASKSRTSLGHLVRNLWLELIFWSKLRFSCLN